MDTMEYVRLRVLLRRPCLPMRTIDWEFVDTIGARARLEEIFPLPWISMMCITGPVLRELALEFMCSFQFNPKTTNVDTPKAISFYLCNRHHTFYVPEFAGPKMQGDAFATLLIKVDVSAITLAE
ncbi:hypothetical protein L1987_08622 [Smallanthus sonchifolius]|uniref:Uncharacterized protein n=1 Tax=Smallanthus sonchifolius TaxID=185202 RepID=A0ACB9JMW6_9ASTR|nr:hypothetical protein L1987_08622 [Smallanthus sonchifolius]